MDRSVSNNTVLSYRVIIVLEFTRGRYNARCCCCYMTLFEYGVFTSSNENTRLGTLRMLHRVIRYVIERHSAGAAY